MTVSREISKHLLRLAKQYPVITITGPRQSGKTTLVKKLFKNKKYFSLEDPDTRDKAVNDPRSFLEDTEKGIILDEIQKAPALLSYIQGIVDNHNIPGEFILTGSQQFQLMKSVSQSLAGRTALVKLLPFSLAETAHYKKHKKVDTYLLKGFYPRVWSAKLDPYHAYSSYFETYIQRDLREMINIKELAQFQKFVRLCAGRIGQVFNATSLSNDLGVSVHTVKSWMSVLETSYTVFLLPPYYENIGNRLIKSPKIYFYDVGLASYLLGMSDESQLQRDRAYGFFVENFVVLELLKKRFNQGKDSNLFFYRDRYQKEIDILIKRSSRIDCVEIKAGKTFSSDFLNSLHYLKKLLPDKIDKQYLVYQGEGDQKNQGVSLINVLESNAIDCG